MKDVRVSGWFFPTFAQIIRWYRCHNLPQTTWLHKSTNISSNMWLRQRNLSLPLTYFHRSLYMHIKFLMRQLRKCSHVVTAVFLDHNRVQKTDKQTRKACKSLAFGSWFISFSRVLPTSRVGYHAGKPIESVVYCLNKTCHAIMSSANIYFIKWQTNSRFFLLGFHLTKKSFST